jgi:hypothetical protein
MIDNGYRGRKSVKNSTFGKGLAFTIIVLFVGMNILPIATGLSMKKATITPQRCTNSLSDDNDTTPPVTTIYFDPPTPNGLNGWYITNVTVTLNATDNQSGVYKTYCSLSPGGNYTGPIVVSQDGVYAITYWSIDNAGNVEVIHSVVLRIDKTPPEITVTVEKIGFMTWRVTANVSDVTSGVDRIEIYWNDALTSTITGPPFTFMMIITWEFKYVIKIIAYDKAGNNASSPPITSTSCHQRQPSGQHLHQFFFSLIIHHPMANQQGMEWYKGGNQ